MGDVHQLVLHHGREGALQRLPAEQHYLVNIAADLLSEDSNALSLTYSGFCQAALPHRRLGDDQPWELSTERVRLVVEPGRRPARHLHGDLVSVGVPFGSRARLILLYLQTEALRTKSREVEIGRSMRDWLRRMGIAAGGKTQRDVREQATRISLCKLTFFYNQGRGIQFANERIVDGGLLTLGDGEHDDPFSRSVVLSATFYEALRNHPVPLWEPAIRYLANNSMALDLYVWLAYRLHSLSKPTQVHWPKLCEQFGAGFKLSRQFKPTFVANLQLALAVYEEARVQVLPDGLMLYPSPPPIPERVAMPAGDFTDVSCAEEEPDPVRRSAGSTPWRPRPAPPSRFR